MTNKTMTPWWGEYSLARGQTGRWRMGALTLWIERAQQEWRIASRRETFAGHEEMALCGGIPHDVTEISRFGFSDTGQAVRLLPMLADRPVISRPEESLFIPAGEAITLYVSSPLWLAVHAGEPQRLLRDMPLIRPSDTWFGPPVSDGGLAYAANTSAKTDLGALLHSPFSAITPLLIRNKADSLLPIERLNLPVPFFALYRAEDGTLWTDGVTLEREGVGDDLASLRLGKGCPREAGRGTLLAEPRRHADKNLVFQAFSRIFS